MSTTHEPPRTRTRRGRRIAIVLLVLAGLLGGTAYLFRERLGDEWALQKFRRAAATGDPDLPRHRELLTRRLGDDERFDRAVGLAHDPDPRVRAAAVDVLMANQPRAQQWNATAGVRVTSRASSWRTAVVEAVRGLLKDHDDTVRQKAVQVVSEAACADEFRDQLTDAVRLGSPAERVAIAATLAHWNGNLLREVIGDLGQPAEVRIAAMKSLDTYGDTEIGVFRGELQQVLVVALRSPNPEVRRAAIPVLRYARMAPNVWLDVVCDPRQKDHHALALQTWIDALAAEAAPFPRHWSDTHQLWFESTSDALRCATAAHVLCEAAKIQIRQLEGSPIIGEMTALRDRQGPTGRAFEVQLARLGNVLSVLSAVRWYCETIEKPPELSTWLPHETPNGAPPKRELKAALFAGAKPIWEWSLARKDGYSTRFLTEGSIVRSYANKAPRDGSPVRPLGTVMDELLVGPDRFAALRKQYEGK